MSRNSSALSALRALLLALTMAMLPAVATAQTGTVGGRVMDDKAAPVQGAQVTVVGTRFGALSDAAGRFSIAGVPAGSHQLRVDYPGFQPRQVAVTVTAGQTATAEVTLQGQAIQLGGVTVSASRRPERVTDAPATVTAITPRVLEQSVGSSWAGVLKDVKGLDFIQVGMTSVALNARGFNSSFNNRMLMIEDGRIAVLPENGLPVGQFTALPKVDLAGIEVLVGPGAALYGADASNGVVTLLSKDPRQFQGTTVEMTGGNRNYKDLQARHAAVFGNWGVKVAGEWQDADDWDNYLTYNIAGVPGRSAPVPVAENQMGVNSIDWNASVKRASGAVVRYFDNAKLEFSGGASVSNGVGQTNVGRNQLRGWGYNFAQARYSSDRWYLNAYRAQSTSGESFAVNRYADALARNPNLSPDSLRKLSDWPSDGRMYAAELQNNLTLPGLLNTRVVWGAQYRQDVVSSDRQWLTDRLTGEDISIAQHGVYAQTESRLAPWLNLVLAGRYDDHENYAAQFSPKAALVFKPTADQALRVSYNQAFKSPTTLQTNFYIPDWTAIVAIYGNTEGFTVKNRQGAVVREYAPLVPERNETWEMGYKGVLAQRLFVDVAGYHSEYDNFMSPLAVIANPFAGANATFAFDGKGKEIKNLTGISPLALTYYNLGRATVRGVDAGVNYYLTPRINLKGTLSVVDLNSAVVETGREEATTLNSPEQKWTVGADFTDVGHFLNGWGSFQGGFTLRKVQEYYFRSGINMGVIPSFSTLDANVGYNIPRFHSTLNVGVSNLFSCSQDDQKPFTYASSDPLRTAPTNRSKKCGVNLRHQEMINMPAIGTMVFVGLRYHLQ